MGFAASNKPIVYTTIPADNVGLILSGLHTAFTAAGWAPTAITGGYQYLLTDPNPDITHVLLAKVRVTDDSSGFVKIQFVNLDEDQFGYSHHIGPATGREFQVWANCCQFFISVFGVVEPGVSFGGVTPTSLATVSGGIPFVGGTSAASVNDCIPDVPGYASEVWWSSGDDDIFNLSNFRSSVAPSTWSAYYNGILSVPSSVSPEGTFRLLPKAVVTNWPSYFGVTPRTRFYGELPLNIEPFIGWGLPDSVARLRAQLYDSFVRTVYTQIDEQIIFQGFNFVNFQGDPPFPVHIDKTRFSSLFLLLGSGANSASYAYIY